MRINLALWRAATLSAALAACNSAPGPTPHRPRSAGPRSASSAPRVYVLASVHGVHRKKAVCGDHKYGIEDNLRRFYRVQAEPVVRLVPRSNDPLPAAVLQRWQRLHDRLSKRLSTGQVAPAVAKGLRRRRVLARLQAAIQTRGRAQ